MKTPRLLTLSIMSLLLAACGESAAERAIERAMEEDTDGDAQVDMQADGSMRVENDEGTAIIGGGSLPSGWPEEIGVYPGASISYSASVNPETGEPGMAVVLMSTDAVAAIAAHYKGALTAAGWTMGDAMEGQGTSIMTATKGTMTASFMITGASGQTSITIGIETGAGE
jgi:hypothetical protein